jgi:putative inorganic carbon (HCO3(-)) transporter
MLPLRASTPQLGWLLPALIAAAAFSVAVALPLSLATGVVIAAVAAPLLILTNRAPAWALMTLYPPSSSLDTSGIGGFKLLSIGILACWVIGILLGTQQVSLRLCALDLSVVALFISAFSSIILFSESNRAVLFQQYGGDLVLYFVIRSSLTTGASLLRGLELFSLGCAGAALIGLWQYGSGLGRAADLNGQDVLRAQLVGTNTNQFGEFMGMGIAIALLLLLYYRGTSQKTLWLLIAVLEMIAFVLTFSRGAFVGLAAAVLVAAVMSTSKAIRRAGVLLIASTVVLAQPVIASRLGLSLYVDRITSIGQGYQGSAGRNLLWEMGWISFRTHPLFGLGLGNFVLPHNWDPLVWTVNAPSWFLANPQPVHNVYLAWAVDVGLSGVVFLALALLLACYYLVRTVWTSRSDELTSVVAHATMLVFVAYFAALTFSTEQAYPLPYMILACVGSLWIAAERDHMEARRDTIPLAQEEA